MIRVAICDDNSTFLKFMQKKVYEEFSKRNISIEINNYVSGKLLQIHHKNKPFDVVFLDIDMPQINGFELSATLTEGNNNVYIIFVTNHSELVYDSFFYKPLNFITKGNNDLFTSTLNSVIDQLLNEIKQNELIILENKDIGRKSFFFKDVLFIESNKHYVIYHINSKSNCVQVRGNIGELSDAYEKNDFVRIHKKYLVNLRHVFNLDKSKDRILFKQGFELPMSRNYKATVDNKLTDYLRRRK